MWGVYRRSVVAVVVVLGVVNVRIRLLASRRGMRSRQSMGLTQIGRACPSPSAQMPSRERIVKGRQLNSGGACGGVARRCWKRQNDSLRNVWDSLAAGARCRSADTMRRSSGRRQNAVPSPWDACLWAVNGSCFEGSRSGLAESGRPRYLHAQHNTSISEPSLDRHPSDKRLVYHVNPQTNETSDIIVHFQKVMAQSVADRKAMRCLHPPQPATRPLHPHLQHLVERGHRPARDAASRAGYPTQGLQKGLDLFCQGLGSCGRQGSGVGDATVPRNCNGFRGRRLLQ